MKLPDATAPPDETGRRFYDILPQEDGTVDVYLNPDVTTYTDGAAREYDVAVSSAGKASAAVGNNRRAMDAARTCAMSSAWMREKTWPGFTMRRAVPLRIFWNGPLPGP